MSLYTQESGAKFISPGGQSEPGRAFWDAQMRWATLNIADGTTWEQWGNTRNSLREGGDVRFAVGGRVENFDKANPLNGVDAMLAIAIAWDVDCVLNIESEFKNISPAQFEQRIQQVLAAHPGYKREVLVNTNGWLFNATDYTPMAHRAFLLQCYPHDTGWTREETPQKVADCIWHAHDMGLPDVGVTFEADDYVTDPTWWDFWGNNPRSYFTGDWIGSHKLWPQYAPKATPGPQPPTNGGDEMQVIGSQHGITAAVNRFRDKDPAGTLLQKSGNKWPPLDTLSEVPLDQWKAYDKLERTLRILRQDHDEALGVSSAAFDFDEDDLTVS